MRARFLGLCSMLFFGFCPGRGYEPKPAPVLALTPQFEKYPSWLYDQRTIWIEIQNGKTIAWVRGWSATLRPDDPKKFSPARERVIIMAQRAAITLAASELHLLKFDLEFDEPVVILAFSSIFVFVRMRVDLDSAKRAPPPSSGDPPRARHTLAVRFVFAQYDFFLYSFFCECY